MREQNVCKNYVKTRQLNSNMTASLYSFMGFSFIVIAICCKPHRSNLCLIAPFQPLVSHQPYQYQLLRCVKKILTE